MANERIKMPAIRKKEITLSITKADAELLGEALDALPTERKKDIGYNKLRANIGNAVEVWRKVHAEMAVLERIREARKK